MIAMVFFTLIIFEGYLVYRVYKLKKYKMPEKGQKGDREAAYVQ